MIRHPPSPTLFPYPPLSRSPGIGAPAQRRHPRGTGVPLEPLDRLALGASGRDDDGSHLGRRRDGFGGADEVDRRAQVQGEVIPESLEDRKSTRLNSSHSQISYAVFCFKKKKKDRSIQMA